MSRTSSSQPGRHRQPPAAREDSRTKVALRHSALLTAAIVVLVLAAVLTGSTRSSGAWFASSDTINANSTSTGHVDLTLNPTSAGFTVSGLYPGTSGYGLITVANAGPLPYRYALTQSATGSLSAARLDYEVKVQTNTSSCQASGWGSNGTLVRSSTSFATTSVFGNPSAGAHSGDRVLGSGASEHLCVRVTLPLSAPSSTQASSLTSTFTFAAEQTTNN